MRIILLILSFYISFLTVMPCEHNTSTTDSLKVETAQQIPAEHHSNNHCSPFCVCSCCNTLVLVNYEFFQLKDWCIGSQLDAVYLTSNPSQVLFPIWQPPKLA